MRRRLSYRRFAVLVLGLLVGVATVAFAKVQGGPGTPILHVNPGATSAGWPITVSGGPQGGADLNVRFDQAGDGSLVANPLLQGCYVSPAPSNTTAMVPPGFHVISALGAKQVFLTSSPSTNGTATAAGLLPINGQNLAINGAGFAPNSDVVITVYLKSGGTLIANAATDAKGNLATSVFLSWINTSALTYAVWLVQDASNNFAYGSTVLAWQVNPPTLTFMGNQGPMGAIPTVIGNNYTPGAVLAILFLDGTRIGGATVNAQGSFTAVVKIPSGYELGQYAVQAVPAGGGMGGGWSTYTIVNPTIAINPATQTFFPPPDPAILPVQIQITVSGKGWLPSDSVTINGLGTYTADKLGQFQVTQPYSITSLGSFVFTGTDTAGNLALMLFWAGMATPC